MSLILQPPTFSEKLKIFSDGNEQYTTALNRYFRKDCLEYGQLIKIKENGRLAHKIKRKVFGNPLLEEIDTVNIESYNGVLREKVSRLVRKTKCFSKKRNMFEKHLDIMQTYQNLIKIKEGNTPMMLEEKTSKIWQWNDIFMYR